eukprot:jgi/Chlat1/8941/Chrsp94S08245
MTPPKGEARSIFRQHRDETDPKKIEALVFEAESRAEYAVHYGIPYPRLHNIPTGALPPGAMHVSSVGRGGAAREPAAPAVPKPVLQDDDDDDDDSSGLARARERARQKRR